MKGKTPHHTTQEGKVAEANRIAVVAGASLLGYNGNGG